MLKRINIYTLTLYDYEDKQHEIIYKDIKKNYEYASIIHDKDINKETGEIIKKHRHVIVILPNARTIESISKEYEINKEKIEIVHNKKYMIRYLIHKDNPEKYQYKIEDIETNIEIEKYFKEEKENESEQIKKILNYINCKKRYISMQEIVTYAIEENCYCVLRRSTIIIKTLLEENNRKYNFEKTLEKGKKQHEEIKKRKEEEKEEREKQIDMFFNGINK